MIEEPDYLRMLEEGFENTRQDRGDTTRLQYIGEHIFGFVTYEQEYEWREFIAALLEFSRKEEKQ